MTEKLGHEVAEIGVRLLDDAYIVWFAAESECEQALRVWLDGPLVNRAEAYFAYRAALDREEAAARDLQRLSQLAQPCSDSLASRNTGDATEAQRGQRS
jgi:hypothetical protein